MQFTSAGITDRGLNPHRLHNEDYYLIAEPLYIVADGLGGELAGEVASRMTVETFKQYFDDATRENGGSPQSELAVIERVIRRVNYTVHLEAQKPEFRNMGSTLTVLYFMNAHALIGHVGDSKIFLYRQGKVSQLTHDHSMVQQMVDKGVITAEKAKTHPMRNVLLNCIAHKPEVEIFTSMQEVQNDDRFLLCSDGVSEYLWPEDLKNIFELGLSPKETCQVIRRQVLKHGAMDNLTAIVVFVQDSD